MGEPRSISVLRPVVKRASSVLKLFSCSKLLFFSKVELSKPCLVVGALQVIFKTDCVWPCLILLKCTGSVN